MDRYPLKLEGRFEPFAKQQLTCHIVLQVPGHRWAQTPQILSEDRRSGAQIFDYAILITQMTEERPGGLQYDVEVMRELCGSYADLMGREFYKNPDALS